MAYIGKQPVVGNFVKLDAITTSATATYNLLNGGVAYFPQTANNCIVSLNGVIQSPTSAYTISGSTIVFSDALTASDSIDFILVLGDVLNIGTPSDNTITTAKLASGLVVPVGKGGTGLTALGTASQVLRVNSGATALEYGTISSSPVKQIVEASDDTLYSLSIPDNSTDVAGSIAYSITPSSASNKILISFFIPQIKTTADVAGIRMRLYRQIAGGGYSHVTAESGTPSGNRLGSLAGNYARAGDGNRSSAWLGGTIVDSPNTTSAIDYKFYFGSGDGTPLTIYVNRTQNDDDSAYTSRTLTHVTLMEIS
jgi:hypothetical protein